MHTFPHVFPLNPFMYPVPYMSHSPPIWSYFLWSPKHIQSAVWIIKLLLLVHLSQAASYLRPLGPNTSLRTRNSNALNQWYYYSVTDRVSHSHKTAGRTAALRILALIFIVKSKLETKQSWPNGGSSSLNPVRCPKTVLLEWVRCKTVGAWSYVIGDKLLF